MKLIFARLLIGAAALISASLGAPIETPAASQAPSPVPMLQHLDHDVMTTPTPEPTATAAAPEPIALTPYEVFKIALVRSSWPMAAWPIVEARVACENTTYDPTDTRLEENGTVSTGLLMVNSVHEDLARDYDLTDPLQNLNAGRIVADRHARMGLPTPWQYCDGRAAR